MRFRGCRWTGVLACVLLASCSTAHQAHSGPGGKPEFPTPGTYVLAAHTPADRLLVAAYGDGVTGTLAVYAAGSSASTNYAFIGRIDGGDAVLSFTKGNAVVTSVTSTSFDLADCNRWIADVAPGAACRFVRA